MLVSFHNGQRSGLRGDKLTKILRNGSLIIMTHNNKTHKEGNPLRLITSCCENLSAFTEFYLKPLAQNLPSFVKDTTHFLQKIEDLNKTGPFPEGSLLVSWDVVAMFPNIDNNLEINAITDTLNSRATNFPSTECIVEAVEMCLQHNNSQFNDENFLQIEKKCMQLC